MSLPSNTQNKISNRLQQDIVKIAGKNIFINPFLYWRRFDENTDRWLREPGQMTDLQIHPNRNRFYPELDWSNLSLEEKNISQRTPGLIVEPAPIERIKKLDLLIKRQHK